MIIVNVKSKSVRKQIRCAVTSLRLLDPFATLNFIRPNFRMFMSTITA